MSNRFSFYFWERRNVNLEIHPLQHFCYREQICRSIFICSKISLNMNVSHKTVSIDKTHFLLISGTKWYCSLVRNTKLFNGIETLSPRRRLTDKSSEKSSSIFITFRSLFYFHRLKQNFCFADHLMMYFSHQNLNRLILKDWIYVLFVRGPVLTKINFVFWQGQIWKENFRISSHELGTGKSA